MAKVAVIAVHGVADQQPYDSARQVAGMLTTFGQDYAPFDEKKIRIPLERVDTPGATTRTSRIADRSDYVVGKIASPKSRGAAERDQPGYAFMLDQLAEYRTEIDEAVVDSVRLESANKTSTVHVYEAYWADLSRLKAGVFSFFASFYQLLLHLPSLGRIVVDHETVLQGATVPWRVFAFLQRWAARMLTIYIAIINLTLLTFALPLLALKLDRLAVSSKAPCSGACAAPIQPLVNALIIGGIALVVFALAAVLMYVAKARLVTAIVTPLIAAVVAAALTLAATANFEPLHVLAFLLWLIAALLAGWLMHSYSVRRPGAFAAGVVALVVTGGVFLTRLFAEPSVSGAVLQAFQIMQLALPVAWIIHLAFVVATFVAGVVCWMRARDRKAQARHVAWTARATISLSTGMFAAVTIILWGSAVLALERLIPNQAIRAFPVFPARELYKHIHDFVIGPHRLHDLMDQILIQSASSALLQIAIAVALLVAALLWTVAPSVITETTAGARRARHASNNAAERLGVWFTNGLTLLPLAVDAFAFAWMSVAAGLVLKWNPRQAVFAAATLLLSSAFVGKVIPAASSALDVMLDVDNYLREHPRDRTPRARIAERFTSLLRVVAAENYDSVIIVAHSQGSVIAADLLRFLRISNDPVFAALKGKLVFFTMGNPLRALYWRAFPPLYTWMDAANEPTAKNALGIPLWINAYRSGDYVGRWIWRGDSGQGVWDRQKIYHQGQPEEEFCVGAGAHLHYWDATADDVGAKLAQLVG